MSKITSKLQVTIPKVIADQHQLKPGDEVDFRSIGNEIVLVPKNSPQKTVELTVEEKLALMKESWKRQEERNRQYKKTGGKQETDRGWTREELYDRGFPR